MNVIVQNTVGKPNKLKLTIFTALSSTG